MPLTFHHVDELPYPRPSNLVLIDCKSVLGSVSAPLASENPNEEGLLQDIVAGLLPSGARPCTAETFLPGGSEPWRRVALCALPDECSRHNSPAQPHAITDCARSVCGSGSVSIMMCLADSSYAFAAGCAVARAFPVYSCVSRKRPAGSTSPAPPPSKNIAVYLQVPSESWVALHKELTFVSEGVRLAARLVDTPPNFLHTSAFVDEAMAVASALEGNGVTAKVIRGHELAEQGFGGIYGVGKAAIEPPALVVLSYPGQPQHIATKGFGGDGATPSSTGSVCFVGKGIIYDTGGLSIKSKTGMPGMKRDMGGAAAVLAAFQAAVQVGKGAYALHAVLCLAENSVDAAATRPDDVLTLYSGKTVEINNTDAEGRLVLSDGVAYAVRHLEPSVIVDVATLTGAQGVATGRRHAAVMSNDEGLERLAVTCGRSTGDLVHPVIYCPEFFSEEFRSAVADMKNSVADRSNAQVSCAGQFIANHMDKFVNGKGRWLHVDMASPAHQGERATGFGVALLFSLLHELDASHRRGACGGS